MKVIAYSRSGVELEVDGVIQTFDNVIHIVSPAPEGRMPVETSPASFARVDVPETAQSPAFAKLELVPSEHRAETDDELVARVALKDVPAGVPYKIANSPFPIADEDLAAWFAGLGEPDGVGMGAEAWFAADEAARVARADALQAEAEERLLEIEQENAALAAEWMSRQQGS